MSENKERIKKIKWVVLFICLICFLAIAEDVLEDEIFNADISFYNFLSEHVISDSLTPIVKVITNFGGIVCLVILAILSFVIIKNKKIGLAIIGNLGISAILNYILKIILQRPRPTGYRLIEETGYSFPSGHSMASMAFYGFFVYLVYKNVKNKYAKWSLITVLSLLIILIGLSRVYLGVHYLSDVLGGFLVTISYLIIYIQLIKDFIFEK